MDDRETVERIGEGNRRLDRAIWMAVGAIIGLIVAWWGYFPDLRIDEQDEGAIVVVAIVAVCMASGFAYGTYRQNRQP